MHILFLTDNFPPECNAPATRTFEHAKMWQKAGHSVTVITCAPNFPQGKIYQGFKNKWYQTEQMNGIKVVRVKTYITANEGFIGRIFDYCSFMVMGAIASIFQKKPDVVVATSPQFFCAMGGYVASVFKRKPFVLEIRDLWPASIVALGVLKESMFIRFMEKIEYFLYRRAAKIIVVTHSFKAEMVINGIDPDKIEVVLNGVDADEFFPEAKTPEVQEKYGINGKFTVGYIGTHGMAHDLVNVLKAIKQLEGEPAIRFIFMGAGAQRAHIEELAKEWGMQNIAFFPSQARAEVPSLLNNCDVCLVPLKDSPVFASVIPSKLFECQATGTPVVMSLPQGEATDIVNSTACGVVVPPESPDELAGAILALHKDKRRLEQLSENALLASKQFLRPKLAEKMLSVMLSLVPGSKPIVQSVSSEKP